MDSLYRLVVALNNKGAACIHNDLLSAKAFFERALESAMTIFLMSSVPAESRIRSCGTTDSWRTSVLLSTEEKRTLEKIPIIAESTFVRAIVLNESPLAYSADPNANLEVACVIVIFNLAIAYHREGLLAREDEVERKLQQAKEVYQNVLDSLLSIGVSLTKSSGHAIIDLIVLAISNNLAQLFYTISDYGNSQWQIRRLTSYSSSIRTEFLDGYTAYVLGWHISVFAHNSAMLKTPLLAPAA